MLSGRSFVNRGVVGLSTSDFLFTPTPIPPLSQGRSSADTAFQKYQLSLKRQLVGRSPPLDSVLTTVEDCARTIQHDFSLIKGFEEENIRFVSFQLKHFRK